MPKHTIRGGFLVELQQLINRYQLAINSIYREVNNLLKEQINEDITSDQFALLQYISEENACTSTKIANAFGVGKSAVTALVNRLHDKGLIARKRDEEDRRIIYLTLTDGGKALVSETESELYQVIGEKLRHFEQAEIENYIHALEKLASLMKK